MGIGQVKMSQGSLFLLTFSYFSGINVPQIAKSPLLISRTLKKLILTIFASFLIPFMERICGGPYSTFLLLSLPANLMTLCL